MCWISDGGGMQYNFTGQLQEVRIMLMLKWIRITLHNCNSLFLIISFRNQIIERDIKMSSMTRTVTTREISINPQRKSSQSSTVGLPARNSSTSCVSSLVDRRSWNQYLVGSFLKMRSMVFLWGLDVFMMSMSEATGYGC